VVKEINDCHGAGRAKGWHCDVVDMAAVQKVTDEVNLTAIRYPRKVSKADQPSFKVAAHFGTIDFLVNAAGIGGASNSLIESSPIDFMANMNKTVDINLMGTCRFMATCTPYLVKASANSSAKGLGPKPDGTSRIVNIASVSPSL
jgi:NAD(P)-dependent dehydrogenase (short-subunit alcohol dehydrogenase family)